jgi:hypothetical protein
LPLAYRLPSPGSQLLFALTLALGIVQSLFGIDASRREESNRE